MDLNLALEISNYLDSIGLYKDAEALDLFVKEAAQSKKQNKYPQFQYPSKNLLMILSLIYLAKHNNMQAQQYLQQMNMPPQVVQSLAQQPLPNPPTDAQLPQIVHTLKKHFHLPKGQFGEFKSFLSEQEGGLSKRKKKFDPGGLTNKGITQKTYNQFRDRRKLPRKSVKHITDKEVDAITKIRYWKPIKAEHLPENVALVIADWKFNGGWQPKYLQHILGIPLTNRMDKNTIMKVWEYTQNDPVKEQDLAQKLISRRQKYLESLKTKGKHNKKVPLIKFNRGWYKRLNELKDSITENTQENLEKLKQVPGENPDQP